jgi:putative aldouronate transport system substrate-binding protein
MKWGKQALMVCTALTLLMSTACSDNNNKPTATNNAASTNNAEATEKPAENVDPVGKYAETVEFTTVLGINQDPKFPEGESYESNMFLKFMEEQLNVKQKTLWMAPTDGEQYFNKLSIAVASGDIPDMFVISGNKKDALLKQLVEGDMIEDLTEEFEQYASPRLREIYGALDNESLNQVSFDGKLMAIPGQKDLAQSNVVWVRQDWLEELGLPNPDTIDNLKAVAKAFAEKKGMGLTLRAAPDGISSKLGDMHKFDHVFNYYGAYPRIWVKKPDGTIEWGGIQPEVKEGLKVAAEMYADGSIDKEFAIKDNGKTAEDIGANKTGLFFQPWWAPFWPLSNSVTNDPNAKWQAYGIAKDGVMNVSMDSPASDYLVVRKGFSNPEALVKMVNLSVEIKGNEHKSITDARNSGIYKDATPSAKNAYFPGMNAEMTDHNSVVKGWAQMKPVMDGKADESTISDIGHLEILKQLKEYEAIKDGPVPADKIGQWQTHTAWTIGLTPSITHKENIVFDAFPGVSPAMEKRWAQLETLQNEMYIQIVMGDATLEDFDAFVEEWKSSGGDEITKEVNELAKK